MVSAYAQSLQTQVAAGSLTDAAAVVKVMRAAANRAAPDFGLFVQIIANVLCDLRNWPTEVQRLVNRIAVQPVSGFFVPFANSGFCRMLRDDPGSDDGNIPRHMLAYFVMRACGWHETVVLGGVAVHELDTLFARGANPDMMGDLRSGQMAVGLAQVSTTVNLFPDLFQANAVMPYCGHEGCQG